MHYHLAIIYLLTCRAISQKRWVITCPSEPLECVFWTWQHYTLRCIPVHRPSESRSGSADTSSEVAGAHEFPAQITKHSVQTKPLFTCWEHTVSNLIKSTGSNGTTNITIQSREKLNSIKTVQCTFNRCDVMKLDIIKWSLYKNISNYFHYCLHCP